jgi:hypothetical protein
VRCCASRTLTPLLAISAVAGCGGASTPERTATTPAPPLPADLRPHHSGTAAAGRAAIVAAAETAITDDARARARRGEFRGPVLRTSCKPRGRPGDPTSGPVVVYSCIAISFVGPRTTSAPRLVSGQPFQARIDFEDRSFTWCKYLPPGGEGTGRRGAERPPPAACGGVA